VVAFVFFGGLKGVSNDALRERLFTQGDLIGITFRSWMVQLAGELTLFIQVRHYGCQRHKLDTMPKFARPLWQSLYNHLGVGIGF
jgi:hypothetical protein